MAETATTSITEWNNAANRSVFHRRGTMAPAKCGHEELMAPALLKARS